jgi:23S rRNA (uracil1939-C5)-methyltransferase
MNQEIKLKKESGPVSIHSLSHDGRGIATINHKTTFLEGALPNEIVTYKVTQQRKQFGFAKTTEVLKVSPDRIDPVCTHFGICGGCTLQHMNIESQRKFKEQTFLEQLFHFGKVQPSSILPPLYFNSVGYRRKARLGVKFVIKKNKLLVGFREKGSHYLADLSRCEVLHPLVGNKIEALADLVTSLSLCHQIPQIEVAIGDQTVALVFRHLAPLIEHDKEKLISFGTMHDFHIYLQPNSPLPITKLWPGSTDHRLTYTLSDYGLTFSFHPLDFTQINLEVNRLMVKQALSLLDLRPTDRVLDLFCGIGNFTLPIARTVHHVTGIEGHDEMVLRAKENASLNGLNNVRYESANLTAPCEKASWCNGATYNKILLDPPRVGAKEMLPYFNAFRAQKIVYISCNPATLARDAYQLVHQYGFNLKQVGTIDMFPHTSHIEAMAVFEKT